MSSEDCHAEIARTLEDEFAGTASDGSDDEAGELADVFLPGRVPRMLPHVHMWVDIHTIDQLGNHSDLREEIEKLEGCVTHSQVSRALR